VNGGNGRSQKEVHQEVHLLSVVAPQRLQADVVTSLRRCAVVSIGDAAAMRSVFGVLPHPGVFEDGSMKLPMGLDYWEPSSQEGEV
jgi:hypothetical protein